MKNAKFNVICMSCGDVITTSCESVFGIAVINEVPDTGEIFGYWMQNGYRKDNNNGADYSHKEVEGFAPGIYHINSDHEIIGKCNCTEAAEIMEKHNIGAK